VFNRLADKWRPLFAIAEIAGGGWRERRAEALSKLNIKSVEIETLRVQLLSRIDMERGGCALKWMTQCFHRTNANEQPLAAMSASTGC
jgi:hypothetical protein